MGRFLHAILWTMLSATDGHFISAILGQSPSAQALTPNDIIAIRRKMKNLNTKYEHVAWFIASSTSNRNCKRVRVRTGRRGRPKTILEGKDEKLHIHLGFISREVGKSASMYADEVQKFILKRKKCSHGVRKVPLKGIHFVGYAYNQSDHFYTSGDYDFKKYFNLPRLAHSQKFRGYRRHSGFKRRIF